MSFRDYLSNKLYETPIAYDDETDNLADVGAFHSETNTKWDLSKANLDWWPHKNVYPIFPIMLLLHLLIPIRGIIPQEN